MKNNLNERFLNLSIEVLNIGKGLNKTYEGKHIYNQLFRSITSAGANYAESRSAESQADFIHKLQIVLKELKESRFWIMLIMKSDLRIDFDKTKAVYSENEELIKIIAKSIITAKNNKSNQ